MKYLVLLGIFSLFYSVSSLLEGDLQDCRHGWQSWKSFCFLYSEDKESWAAAEGTCRIFGGHLLEIHDNETSHVVTDHLKLKHYGDTDHAYWIGLTDIAQDGSWEWLESALPLDNVSYTNWYPGQPDDSDQHCAELYGKTQFLWHDGPCHSRKNFICMTNQI